MKVENGILLKDELIQTKAGNSWQIAQRQMNQDKIKCMIHNHLKAYVSPLSLINRRLNLF